LCGLLQGHFESAAPDLLGLSDFSGAKGMDSNSSEVAVASFFMYGIYLQTYMNLPISIFEMQVQISSFHRMNG